MTTLRERMRALSFRERAALVNKLWALLYQEELAPKTPEEIDEELRATGLDPDEVGARGAALAREAFAKITRRQQ